MLQRMPVGLGHSFAEVRVIEGFAGDPQAKLRVSHPGDQLEMEADRVADRVMRMAVPKVRPASLSQADAVAQRQASGPEEEDEDKLAQAKPLSASITPLVQRQMDPDEDEEEEIQMKGAEAHSGSAVAQAVGPQVRPANGSGHPLDSAARAFMEARFGHDFGQVRVHTDAQAAESARAVNARAYTLGQDVVFGAGQYAPGNAEGRSLLAHELTHVIQQRASAPALQLKPLTEEERKENLKSPRFTGNERLQKAFDNDPVMRKGETEEAVKILQQALIDDLCPLEIALSPNAAANCKKAIMPLSTEEGKDPPDGIFGDETFITVQKFQIKYGLLDPNGRPDGRPGRKTLGKLDELFPAPKRKPPPLPPPLPPPKGKLSIEIKPVIATGSKWDTDSSQLAQLQPRVDWAKKTWMKLASIEIHDNKPTKDSQIPKNGVMGADQAALAGKLGGTNRLIIVILTDQCCEERPDPILPFFTHTLCPDAITKQGPPPSICMSAKTLSFDSLLGHEMGHVFLKSGDHFPGGLMQLSGPYPDTLSSTLITQAQAFFLTP